MTPYKITASSLLCLALGVATGRPVENPAARYAGGPTVVVPSGFGAHNWHPMAFSPDSGLAC